MNPKVVKEKMKCVKSINLTEDKNRGRNVRKQRTELTVKNKTE